MKITVYTSIFGNYDDLRAPLAVDNAVDYVFLTDWQKSAPFPWQQRLVSRKHIDNRREARRCKILSHRFFPDSDITIWHGGNIQLGQLPGILVSKMLGDADIAAFAHPHRNCAYKEAKICLDWKLDNERKIKYQMRRYWNEGFPENYGLTACWFLIRRNTPRVNNFNELWWSELSSVRDQLSFDYVRWKTGMKVQWIPGDLITHPWFKRYEHKR